METLKGEFSISTDKSKLNILLIHNFLKESYWATGIPIEIVETSIKNSLCFGVYRNQEQVGFARVITDCATFAYLADVFILPNERGKGLSKWLMETIKNYPTLQGLRRWMLATRDAHKLYEQYGFKLVTDINKLMEIVSINVYQEKNNG